MKNQLQQKMALYANNVSAMRNDFIWQETATKRLAALVYTLEGKPIDNEAVRDNHRMIKDEVGVFSSFRGNLAIYIATVLSLAEQPKALLSDTLGIYDLLKEHGFWPNDFLTVTAFEIASHTKAIDHAQTVQRTRAFYDEMKANHRLHIGKDDYIFAAMLALTDVEPHAGANKLKRLFQRLKSEFSIFSNRNSLLNLAQMMVLGGNTEDCVTNLVGLNVALRHKKIRLDKTYTLPSLGVLNLLDVPHHTLAEEITEIMAYLREQKGLGHFSVTTQELLLYAVALITSVYAHEAENNLAKAGVTTSVTNLIIAQQVAILMSITAASSAAATSAASC